MGFLNCRVCYKILSGKNGKQAVESDKNVSNEALSLLIKNEDDRITITLIPKEPLELLECRLMTDERITDEKRVFLNGFQTWTDSREVSQSYRIPKLNKFTYPFFSMYGDYKLFENAPDKLQSWTYTYIRNRENNGITFYGSLNENTGYTIFEYCKSGNTLGILKDCKGLILNPDEPYLIFDIFMMQGEEENAFDRYFKTSNIDKPRVQPCTGWTSWYNYYTSVTQNDVLTNLDAFRSNQLPIDIFQIDDGYQEAVGDWLYINQKFPNGMDYLANEIKGAGYKAGLWIAPLICEKKSRIYKEHPDWIVTKAGFNPLWSGYFYVLDFYNEEVRSYLREVFDTVLNKWNYDMVKLDFLYAASLIERRDKTRGQIMYEFMAFLREISGDKIILGCGVPLGCAFGLVDYCRVSSDVALKWEDKALSKLHYRERVSTINALTSTVGRYQLNGRAFYNDPDVFLLRDGKNKLTQAQKYTLFMINGLLGGLVFTSDNITEYTESQTALFKQIFQLKDNEVLRVESGETVKIYYRLANNHFCLISNLSAGEVNACSPFAGLIQDETNPFNENHQVEKNQKITLRPCQSVCIKESESNK